jgi:hypothetical protein
MSKLLFRKKKMFLIAQKLKCLLQGINILLTILKTDSLRSISHHQFSEGYIRIN